MFSSTRLRGVTYGGVQVYEDGARDVLAAARLGEEGLVGAVLLRFLRLGVRLAISLQAMLEEVAGFLSIIVLPGSCGDGGRWSSDRG